MKRLIAIALVGLFGFAFGCGGSASSTPGPETADNNEALTEEPAAEEGMAEEEAPAEEAAGDEMGGEEAAGEEAPAEEGAEAPVE